MKKLLFPFVFLLFALSSCEPDPILTEASGYPREIGKIMLTKCAVEGCHTTASAGAAGGLNLETWGHMMNGGRNGSVVIPGSHKFSSMFLFTNVYPELGLSAEPTMPFNDDPLTRDEVITLRDWIDRGAKSSTGRDFFQGVKDKFYVVNQGCDVAIVVDRRSGLFMKLVQLGTDPLAIESPHMVRVAPDGKHWYVCFTGGQSLQKFSTETDELVASIDLTNGNASNAGSWNTIAISPDSKTAFVADLAGSGKVAVADLEQEKLAEPFSYIGPLEESHGTAISPDGAYLYVTAQTGNFVHRVDLQDLSDVVKISLNGSVPTTASSLDIHEIMFSPSGDAYFVTCQKSNEVRVMSYPGDVLIATVPVAKYPQEMDYSGEKGYLFVSCPEDDISYPGHRGSVDVIDMNGWTKIKNIKAGFQPHGLGVDDKLGLVYVANRNASSSGPAPHHTTECGGRNGYLTAIDLNTLEMVPGFRPEVSSDPYSIALTK